MAKIKNVIEEIRRRFLQPFFRKLIGVKQYEQELETLYYIINEGIDITSFPRAKGVLRDVQLADAEMLRIFHEICEKHKLTYWLDYGTLLGAIRHKGFIPWDDDLDVAMPREDYDKVLSILLKELESSELEVVSEGEKRIVITCWKAGMIMDIFPMDKVSKSYINNYEELKQKLKECRIYYKKNRDRMTPEEVKESRESRIGTSIGEQNIWYHNIEFCADGTIYDEKIIFPLKKKEFENYMLWVPNDYDTYLKEIYGSYMEFPKNGVLHHNSTDNKIYENATINGINMERLIPVLKEKTFR